jgi:hypothetical protein
MGALLTDSFTNSSSNSSSSSSTIPSDLRAALATSLMAHASMGQGQGPRERGSKSALALEAVVSILPDDSQGEDVEHSAAPTAAAWCIAKALCISSAAGECALLSLIREVLSSDAEEEESRSARLS